MPFVYRSYATQFTHFIDENQADKQKTTSLWQVKKVFS